MSLGSIDRETRDRLRRAEQRLGITTIEAVRRAVDALDTELVWREVDRYYEGRDELDAADQAWVGQVGRAQR